MIRVLLIDDHPLLRAGFRQLVEHVEDIEIVAEAGSYDEAMSALDSERQDIVVLDICLPDRSGIEVLTQIKQHHPRIGVVVYTRMPEAQFAVHTMKLGASAFLNKSTTPEDTSRAIRTVAEGGTYITASVAAALARNLQRDQFEATHDDLSPREFEVFRLLVDGETTSQIAARLDLSVKTVSTHKKNILNKLALDSTADLVKYAVRHGLESTSDDNQNHR